MNGNKLKILPQSVLWKSEVDFWQPLHTRRRKKTEERSEGKGGDDTYAITHYAHMSRPKTFVTFGCDRLSENLGGLDTDHKLF